MSRVGLPAPPSQLPSDLPPPRVEPDGDGTVAVIIGEACRVGGIKPPARPELVPEVVYYDSSRHTAVLRELMNDFSAGSHLLLIGSQVRPSHLPSYLPLSRAAILPRPLWMAGRR